MQSQMFISLTRTLVATLALALHATHAAAQIIDLPPVIPTQSIITGSEQSQIDAFVAAHIDQINSSDTAAIIRSRNALLKPLESPNVTLAFRQAYGSSVLPIVDSLVKSSQDISKLAGIRIAGKLGIDAANTVLLGMLQSQNDATRFFVVTSLGETMASLASNSPSLSASAAAETIKALGNIIASDDQAKFADAAIRALTAATLIHDPGLESIRTLAIITLAESAGDRLRGRRAADPNAGDEMIAALRACGAVRVAISSVQLEPTRAAAIAAIRLGADSVGYVFSRVRSGMTAQADSNAVEIALLGAGEGTIYQGRDAIHEPTPPQTNLFEQLKRGDERVFNFRTSELIGPESQIVVTYGFDRDRFIRPADQD